MQPQPSSLTQLTCQAIQQSSAHPREKFRQIPIGDLLVTRDVAPLCTADINEALGNGIRVADELRAAGLIHSAALSLQGHVRTAGTDLHDPAFAANACPELETVYVERA